MNIFEILKNSLKLNTNPIGVKLIYNNPEDLKLAEKFNETDSFERYCEYVKRASKGEVLKLKKGSFSCVIGEIFLGFKEPKHIKFDNRLEIDQLDCVLLFPINMYNIIDFDSIILILNPRNCMDIIEAYVKTYNKPLKISHGKFRGICSEITAYVIKNKELNFSYLCSGSRIFAGFDDCDLLCGIPANMFYDLISEIELITQERELDIELMEQLKGYD